MYQQLIAEQLRKSRLFSHIADFNFILDGKSHREKKEGEYNFYYCGSIQPQQGDPSKEELTLTVKNWQDEYDYIRIPLNELSESDKKYYANATKFYREKAIKELEEKTKDPKAIKKAEHYISKFIDNPSNTAPYLEDKKLDKLKGYEFLIDTGSHNESRKLVLPIWQFNEETKEFEISCYQTISRKIKGHRNKNFQSGGQAGGGFGLVSKQNKLLKPKTLKPDHPILIAEGFATGLSISYALDFPVFIAFTGGNISKLAALLRKHNSNKPILICADNDESMIKSKNAGLEFARDAAKESKCCYILPDFTDVKPVLGKDGEPVDFKDFNDLHHYGSLEKVQAQIKAFTLIKPSQMLKTEHVGFYQVETKIDIKTGLEKVVKAKPCYDDLAKFYHRQHPFLNLAGSKSHVEIFNGTHWESKHIDFLSPFVERYMVNDKTKEIASELEIRRFKEKLKGKNVKPSNYFSNTNSRVVCLKNGVYDFDSHILHKHSSHFPVRFCLDYDYDEEATCPKFLEVLERVLPSKTHKEQQDLLLEFLGWALSGDKYWTAGLVYLCGGGSNGKSTILEVMRTLFHGESKKAFSLTDLSNDPKRAQLQDAFVNICEETDDRNLIESKIIKQITDHGVTTASAKYKDPVTFTNRCKFIFSGNKLPENRDCTEGMLRRWRFLDFSQDVSKYKDRDIVEQLKKERSGIFNLAMNKYKEAKERKYFSKDSEELRAQFRISSQSVTQDYLDNHEFFNVDVSEQDVTEFDFDLNFDFSGYAPTSKRPYLVIKTAYKAAMKLAEENGRSKTSQNKFTREFRTEWFNRFGVKLTPIKQRHPGEHSPVNVFHGVAIKRKDYN